MEIIKHLDVFNPADLKNGSVGIIGVGAVGSAVALEIAKLGVKEITLYDPDEIVEHNIPNQILYGPEDAGGRKVFSAMSMIGRLTDCKATCVPVAVNEKFGKLRHDFVFCCVDSMAARLEIFTRCILFNNSTRFYIDGRMNAKTGWAYIIDPTDPVQVKQYRDDPDVMYDDNLVRQDLGSCGVTLSIGPTAHILAGIMTWAFMLAIKTPGKVGELVFTIDPWMLNWRPFETAAD